MIPGGFLCFFMAPGRFLWFSRFPVGFFLVPGRFWPSDDDDEEK